MSLFFFYLSLVILPLWVYEALLRLSRLVHSAPKGFPAPHRTSQGSTPCTHTPTLPGHHDDRWLTARPYQYSTPHPTSPAGLLLRENVFERRLDGILLFCWNNGASYY